MPFECPNCNRPIPMRKHSRCAYCGADVPENMQLSEDERNALEAMKKEEAEKYRQWKEDPSNRDVGSLDGGFDFDIDY